MANVDIRLGHKNTAWFTTNSTLVLKDGQMVVCSDGANQGKYKIGDGVTQLSALTFYGGSGYAFTGLTSQYTRGDGTYATFPTNVSSFTNDSNYLTSSAASSTYVPYTGATSNVNLGTFNITAKTGTFINGIINSGATATGFYIETDNSGNQYPFIINSLSGANSDAILQGVNNSRLIVKNVTSTQRWFIGNDVTNDSFYISSINNPSSSQINFYLNGNINMGNATATNQRLVRIGQDTAYIDIGSLVGSTSNSAFYFNQASPSNSNYNIYGNATTTQINGATTGGSVAMTVNTNNKIYATHTTTVFSQVADTTNTSYTFNFPSGGYYTAGLNTPYFKLNGATKTWATGTLATQYFNYFSANTVAFASASTATNVYGLYVEAATAGTNATITNNWSLGTNGNLLSQGSLVSSSPSGGVGYFTGAGSTVTQITSRTTGVTINNVCGSITLVSAAGTATWQSFTVTNSRVTATDVIIVNQGTGTDLYQIFVTNVAAGSFQITFATTGGTTTEQPVFNFSIIKAVTT